MELSKHCALQIQLLLLSTQSGIPCESDIKQTAAKVHAVLSLCQYTLCESILGAYIPEDLLTDRLYIIG